MTLTLNQVLWIILTVAAVVAVTFLAMFLNQLRRTAREGEKTLAKAQEMLDGMKLPAILSMAQFIDPEKGIWEKWPAGRTFHFSTKAPELCGQLDRLLTLCPAKKGSRRLGFLALHTDGKGTYWFKSEKSLLTARLESLASLECMVDEPGGILDAAQKETVARLYHDLSELLET